MDITHRAEKVRQVIAQSIAVDQSHVTDDKDLRDALSMDSLDRLELTIALEDAFDIELPHEEAETLNTVGQIVALVESKMKVSAS